MNRTQAVRCVLNTARSFLGIREEDGSHRQIIDLYNGHKPLPRGYRMKYDDPWCTAFVAAVGIACGLPHILLPECSADEMIRLYRRRNQWTEGREYMPQSGDLVFFDWENDAQADHVGIVMSVNNGRILLIEGNAGDAVGFRALDSDDPHILGYAWPQYG